MENLKEILEEHLLWLGKEVGERANLSDANLMGADLKGANLKGANLTDANLTGAKLPASLNFTPDADLIKKVANAALASDESLKMDTWHTCETTHCIAGWAIHLHPEGKRLVENSNECLAGRLLLGNEAAEHFFDSDDDARKYLSQFL
jgi:Pentapeptide repeats (8 copies)